MSQERRFCAACGRALVSGAAFCAECGAPTGQAGAPVAAAPAPPPAPASPGPPAAAPLPAPVAPATAPKRRPTLLLAVAALAAAAVVAGAYFTVLKKDGAEDNYVSSVADVSADASFLLIHIPQGWKRVRADNRLIIYGPGASTGWDAPVSGGPRIRIEAPRPAATGAALDAAALSAGVAAVKSGEFRVIEEPSEVEVDTDGARLKGTTITYEDHGVTVRFVSINLKGEVYQIFLEAPASLWPSAEPVLEQAFRSVSVYSTSSTAPAAGATATVRSPTAVSRATAVPAVLSAPGLSFLGFTSDAHEPRPDTPPNLVPSGGTLKACNPGTLDVYIDIESLTSAATYSIVWTRDGSTIATNSLQITLGDTWHGSLTGSNRPGLYSYSLSQNGRVVILAYVNVIC